LPVVEVNLPRLQKLLGSKIDKKTIIERLPFLGLDIESEDGDDIRVEYSPNRADYSTDYGIALGLQGLLGIKKGEAILNVNQKGSFSIRVDSTVSKIRPYVSSIVAMNGVVDDYFIKQLMTMQEDLHLGIGRRRIKSSIGVHDLDKISSPLTYTTINRNHKFTPLNSSENLTIGEILEKTDVGKNYGHILGNSSKVPIILDSNGNTVSFPPIINSALTTVTNKTKNLLVEVTGIEQFDVENMLSIVSIILQTAGFKLYRVKISGSKNSSPRLKSRTVNLDSSLVNQTLGLKLTTSQIIDCIKRSRLGAVQKNKKIICTIPRYRFDVLSQMDLVEEVALGYGIENLSPTLSPSQTIGQKNTISEILQKLSLTMVGLGYLEVMNSSLTSKRVLYDHVQRDHSKMISVLDSKSQEHTILRDIIIAGMLENLSKNIHETYPQKLFETGTVFIKDSEMKEEIHLACVSAHKDANFTECKSILQSLLTSNFGVSVETKTSDDPVFEKGHSAEIIARNKKIGIMGELNSKIIDNYKIRVPVVGFEVKLTGLIFD
jgi:phenylalanyl-tRNA synthetase beta chain